MKEILLLGDSIRMFYQDRVKELLGEAYNVSGPTENGRFAAYTFNSLRMWLPTFPKPDVIHFNNGLWDTAILYAEDGCFTPLDEYIRTMERIVRQLKKTGARLIFATTTPTHPGKAEWVTDMPPRHVNADIERYNAAAVELMDITGRDNAAMRMIRAAWEDQVLALWKYQRENGLYTTLIDVEETYCETSATAAIAYGVLKGVRMGLLTDEKYVHMGKLAAEAVIGQVDETGAVQGVSGGTGMGHTLQHYKDIIVTPTAYGQGLTFLMLTELMQEA